MCNIGYHVCFACQEEYKCDQSDYECNIVTNMGATCQKCEYWAEENEREIEREEQRKWEAEQWAREHGYEDKD